MIGAAMATATKIRIERLYTDEEACTMKSVELARRIRIAIDPIFNECKSNNISIRDLASVASRELRCMEAEYVLRNLLND